MHFINKFIFRNSHILSALIVLTLAGCLVGPDFEPPVMETPEVYRFSDEELDEVVNLKWWELFHDPVIKVLVDTALEENKDILIAIARIEEARAVLGFTGADIYPTIDINGAAAGGTLFNNQSFDDSLKAASIAPVVNWEIDFWGKFRRATESARADLIATEYGARSVQISLISEVVGTYFLLLDFHQRLEVSKDTLESRTKSLDIIQKRFDRGIIGELDLNQAQVQREIAATAIPANERSLASTENALSILLGGFPTGIEIGKDLYSQTIPPEIPVGLPSRLLERRPDILQAMYLLQAQNAQIGVAEALRLPAFSLSAGAGAAVTDIGSMTTSGFVWSIGAGFFWPIFNFGKNKARVQIEEARTVQVRLQYENIVLNAVREVSDSLNEIETYKIQLQALDKQTKAARNANYISNLRYDKGITSFLEVLETERQLFNVELKLSKTTQEYYNSYVRLYKALGGGWISEDAMDTYETSENISQ